jgi:hypothetical protein
MMKDGQHLKPLYAITYEGYDKEAEEATTVDEIVEAENIKDAIDVIIAETGIHADLISSVEMMAYGVCRRGSNKKRGT